MVKIRYNGYKFVVALTEDGLNVAIYFQNPRTKQRFDQLSRPQQNALLRSVRARYLKHHPVVVEKVTE